LVVGDWWYGWFALCYKVNSKLRPLNRIWRDVMLKELDNIVLGKRLDVSSIVVN
jgi:hypothetical protein